MKTEQVDEVMRSMPTEWTQRWCGGENGPCACMGCVQVGNRLIMTGLKAHQIDPEHINEATIPREVYVRYKVTWQEWKSWIKRSFTAQ